MVSVIIPCYNAGDTITACVDSVLQQTYSDFEIIVIDDGSRDQSVAILNKHLAQIKPDMDRISVITQKNMGPSAARNNGIRIARGSYIAFLDSDDYWKPDKLKSQMAVMESDHDISLISCSYNNQSEKNSDRILFIPFKKLLSKNYFAATSTVLVRKEALENLSFNEQQKHSEDYRLWLQIAWRHTCALINEPMAASISQKLEYGQSGLSANLWKMEQGELLNYRYIYKLGYINGITYAGICCFSFMKYLRRKIIILLKRS